MPSEVLPVSITVTLSVVRKVFTSAFRRCMSYLCMFRSSLKTLWHSIFLQEELNVYDRMFPPQITVFRRISVAPSFCIVTLKHINIKLS